MLLNSKGKTKTIVRHNGRQDVNELNWDANYDGKVANVSFDIKDNGKSTHKNLHLTNENLANLLTIPSVEGPLDERLIRDFQLAEKPRNGFQVIKYPTSMLRKKTKKNARKNARHYSSSTNKKKKRTRSKNL
jgi:hypothetical protein